MTPARHQRPLLVHTHARTHTRTHTSYDFGQGVGVQAKHTPNMSSQGHTPLPIWPPAGRTTTVPTACFEQDDQQPAPGTTRVAERGCSERRVRKRHYCGKGRDNSAQGWLQQSQRGARYCSYLNDAWSDSLYLNSYGFVSPPSTDQKKRGRGLAAQCTRKCTETGHLRENDARVRSSL